MKRFAAALLAALAPCLTACTPSAEEAPSSSARSGDLPARPNIVVVVVDDMRWDEFGAGGHPYLETPNIDRLAAEGAMFLNSFHAVPLCSPNRASLLTGQYPSQHGIVDNVARVRTSFALETFPQALQTVGYETAFLGKWHMGNDPRPRDGWDYWVGQPGQGRSIDPELFEDGALHVVEGYTTDILNDRAIDFIQRDRDGPFMVYMAHKAIHPDIQQLDDGSTPPGATGGYVPAPRHRGRYADAIFPAPANAISTLAELDGKPAVQGALARRATGSRDGDYASIPARSFSQQSIRDRAEMMLAVDEGVGRVLETLESEGILDSTVVVFTSENGFFFNEHGLTTERRLPYEDGIRNPFLVRYPPAAQAGDRPEALASTIDLAPTVLDLAGAPIGDHIQGRSLVPVLLGDTAGWRTSVFVEFYTYENPFPHLMDMDYRAVRTDRFKYIHWVRHPGMDELYDLEADPLEMENRIDDPELASVRDDLRAALEAHVLSALGLGG